MNYKNLYPQHSQYEYVNAEQPSFEPFASYGDDYFFIEQKRKKKGKKGKHKKKKAKKLLKFMKEEGLFLVDDGRKKHKKGKKKKSPKKHSLDVWDELLLTCVPKFIDVAGNCVHEYVKLKHTRSESQIVCLDSRTEQDKH